MGPDIHSAIGDSPLASRASPKKPGIQISPLRENLGWLEGAEKNQANTRRTGIKASGNGKLG